MWLIFSLVCWFSSQKASYWSKLLLLTCCVRSFIFSFLSYYSTVDTLIPKLTLTARILGESHPKDVLVFQEFYRATLKHEIITITLFFLLLITRLTILSVLKSMIPIYIVIFNRCLYVYSPIQVWYIFIFRTRDLNDKVLGLQAHTSQNIMRIGPLIWLFTCYSF